VERGLETMNYENAEKKYQLSVDFVDPDYFLARIHEFEKKYKKNWGDFLAEYALNPTSSDSSTSCDFTEWAFLCKHFMSELIRVDSSGPPGQAENNGFGEPELNSGSFFWRCTFGCRGVLQKSREFVGHLLLHQAASPKSS
jgi:hypothetical protein